MDKDKALEAIKKAKEQAQKREFSQSFDLVINLKNLDIKKTDQQIEFFVTLPFSKGKDNKICALVGPELKDEAKSVCEKVIDVDEFPKYADKKAAKKLAEEFGFFIAQANIMPKVATTFGKILGPRGKMPNPKAGCVVPPKAALKGLHDRLMKTIKVSAKTSLCVQCTVGSEKMKDEEVAENAAAVYKQLLQALPNHENNLNTIFLKLTMGKPVKVL